MKGAVDPAQADWDGALKQHIENAHKDEIDVEEKYVWDVYQQALAVQERQSVPAVGAAVDRRAFDTTLAVYNDNRIQALICMCCARICLQTGGPRSPIEYKGGKWLLGLPAGDEITQTVVR